jgi:hypothetical protein
MFEGSVSAMFAVNGSHCGLNAHRNYFDAAAHVVLVLDFQGKEQSVNATISGGNVVYELKLTWRDPNVLHSG